MAALPLQSDEPVGLEAWELPVAPSPDGLVGLLGGVSGSGRVGDDAIRSLWIVVLLRAVADWLLYKDDPRSVRRTWHDNARQWLFEEDRDEDDVGSFRSVCDILGLNAVVARERLLSPTGDIRQLIRSRRRRKVSTT